MICVQPERDIRASAPASRRGRSGRRARSRRCAGRGVGRAAAETLAQLLLALGELVLKRLLLLLQHLGIDRRAIEALGEVGERNGEGDLARSLVLDADVEVGALLHRVDEVVLDLSLGEAAIREADRIAAGGRLRRVDAEADARLQQQAERHQEAHDLVGVALHVIDGDGEHRLALVETKSRVV